MARIEEVEALVVGAGPTGLAAAMTLARSGIHTALTGVGVGARSSPNPRTAALFRPAINLLHNLGVWPELVDHCAPLAAIRIVDDTGYPLRAPEVLFRSSEIGWEAFGYNVPDDALCKALDGALAGNRVRVLGGGALAELTIGDDICTARLENGDRVRARLVVAADGRESLCRTAAGIAVRRWTYGQSAVTTRFAHSRDHGNISTELHGRGGPCTTVPLPGRRSSLVWVESSAEADRLMRLDETEFVAALSDKLSGLLGDLSEPTARRSFPLSGLAADRVGASRVVLVGEAAHVIPPIGAQGLNLGLLDVAVLADCVIAGLGAGIRPGDPDMIARYRQARRTDIDRRMRIVDLLNRSLTSGLLPAMLARGAGLHVLAASPALRRRAMLSGLLPDGPLPSLMQLDGALPT
jgi:2-octaprenyl-6-methoxyphenol hydroxylase